MRLTQELALVTTLSFVFAGTEWAQEEEDVLLLDDNEFVSGWRYWVSEIRYRF